MPGCYSIRTKDKGTVPHKLGQYFLLFQDTAINGWKEGTLPIFQLTDLRDPMKSPLLKNA
jgi:hypothetical protein